MRTDPVSRAPAQLSGGLAVAAAAVGVAAAGSSSAAAGGLSVAGLVGVTLAVRTGVRGAASVGAAGLLAGLFVAGVVGASPAVLLTGTVAAVMAWDLGGFAVDLGAQLGREATTRRVEVVHAAGSLAVGVVVAGLGYGVYLLAWGRQPMAALLLFVVAAVVLVATLEG